MEAPSPSKKPAAWEAGQDKGQSPQGIIMIIPWLTFTGQFPWARSLLSLYIKYLTLITTSMALLSPFYETTAESS